MEGEIIDEKNEKLRLLDSPYAVHYSEKVRRAINYALERGLLEKYKVEYSMIQDYFNKKLEIPMWIVEAACKINLEDINIPSQYQYLWYCLHGTILKRKQPSGREFKTKVNFTSCYVELDQQIKGLLDKACKVMKLPLHKFTILCGYKKAIVNNKKTMPLLALMKICQILKIGIWGILEGYDLFGKTSRVGKIVIPKNIIDVDLMVLLIWLRTEGHVELGSTHIEINQKDNIQSLKVIRKLFIKKFNLKTENSIFWVGNRGEDRLIISSSPLKQLLCLKYGFPLGYKSGSLQPLDLKGFTQEDYKKIMAAFIQTEGCLSYAYTRGKKKKLPKFEFEVKDRSILSDCIFIIRKFGFKPRFYDKQNIFKVGLYNSKQTIYLVHQTEKYFFDNNKIKHLKKVCTNGIGL